MGPQQPPHIPPPPPPASPPDKKAEQESEAFKSARDIEQERAEGDHDRNEIIKGCLTKIILIIIVVAGLALIFGLVIWAWHVLAPDNLRWLCQDDISEIQNIATSALLGIVASEYARRIFK